MADPENTKDRGGRGDQNRGGGRGDQKRGGGDQNRGGGRGDQNRGGGRGDQNRGGGRGDQNRGGGRGDQNRGGGRGDQNRGGGRGDQNRGGGRGDQNRGGGDQKRGGGRGDQKRGGGRGDQNRGGGRGDQNRGGDDQKRGGGCDQGRKSSLSQSVIQVPKPSTAEIQELTVPSSSDHKMSKPVAATGQTEVGSSGLSKKDTRDQKATQLVESSVDPLKAEKPPQFDISPEEAAKELGLRPMDVIPARQNKLGKKKGQPIQLETNFFPIKLKNQEMIAYQYDVTIVPDVPKYMLRPAWNEFIRRQFPNRHPSFDGKKIAVSKGPLTNKESVSDTFEIINPENGKVKRYSVSIKHTSTVNLKNLITFLNVKGVNVKVPSAELAVLDIVLRNFASNTLIRAGRNFYTQPKGQIVSLGEGKEAWYGYYQSVTLGWKMYLNLDISYKGFPISDILKTIEEICLTDFRGSSSVDNKTFLRSNQIEKLQKHLKNLKVEYKIPNDPTSKRVYKVNGVRSRPASEEYFKIDGRDTSVEEYYKNHKNVRLNYPNLPCLWVGSLKNTIYVPMELCKIIPGQVCRGKLTENQTSKMIRYAADPPAERKRKILDTFKATNFHNEFTNEFEISVGNEMEKVGGRVLDPPMLTAGTQDIIKPNRGQWDLKKFFRPTSLKNWCILNLDETRTEIFEKNFERDILDQAKFMGMDPDLPICQTTRCDPIRQPQSVTLAFRRLRERNVALVFVFIPDKGGVYAQVKKISEIEVGVLTQCIRSSTLNKTYGGRGGSNRSTIINILLKVNAKLNGINHSLHISSRPPCLERPAMIVGADVTHPSPDCMSTPSIAAVAASHDPKAFLYNTIRRLQPPTLEIIQDFEEIMKSQLIYFYKKTRFKPEKILVFRDGVSEAQVDIVLKNELMAIRRACTSLEQDYQPKITFLIVQKRHHTRFFPLSGTEFCDVRNPNPPAGTCVDTDIVHPRDLDFYLLSHFSRLGTARPTKYKLIYDDSDMSETELEMLTYYLCHLFSRCNKSISYPAPTYYAHLAAFRARVHLSGINVNMDSEDDRNMGHKKINVKEDFQNVPMFFV